MSAQYDYVPERGDIVWMNFSPQTGTEQAGHRPGFIVSPVAYNSKSRYTFVCPITSNTGEWPWKVFLPENDNIAGAILVDQLKSVDRIARNMKFRQRADDTTIKQVLDMLAFFCR